MVLSRLQSDGLKLLLQTGLLDLEYCGMAKWNTPLQSGGSLSVCNETFDSIKFEIS